MNVAPGASYEAVLETGTTGLTGTIAMLVQDNVGGTTTASATTAISERPTGSGIYVAVRTAPSLAGQYTIVWTTDGTYAPATVATDELVITSSAASASTGGTDYVTLTELKHSQELAGFTFADDEGTRAITAASRACEEYCDRRFWLDADATSVRYYSPQELRTLRLHDLAAITSVAVDYDGNGTFETAWTENTDYVLEPLNAISDGKPYEELRVRRASLAYLPCYERSVKVTGQFGWPDVPEQVRAATMLLAARLMKRMREAPFGIAVVGLDQSARLVARTDPDVAMLLDPLVRGQGVMVA